MDDILDTDNVWGTSGLFSGVLSVCTQYAMACHILCQKNGLLLTVLGVICLLSASGCAQSGHFCF